MSRPDWDQYFMAITYLTAQRATCPRRKVGAVITFNNRILATGYNGSPPGEPHCHDVGCLMINARCERTNHAEENALLHCNRELLGAKIYCTTLPCWRCYRKIKTVGISEIIYSEEYHSEESQRVRSWRVSPKITHLPMEFTCLLTAQVANVSPVVETEKLPES